LDGEVYSYLLEHFQFQSRSLALYQQDQPCSLALDMVQGSDLRQCSQELEECSWKQEDRGSMIELIKLELPSLEALSNSMLMELPAELVQV